MQRFSGLLLMLAGAAMSGYAYLPQPTDDTEKIAEVAVTQASPVAPVQAAISPRIFSV